MSGPPRICQSSGTLRVPQYAAGEVPHRLRTCEPTRRVAAAPAPGAETGLAAAAVPATNPGPATARARTATKASRRESAFPRTRRRSIADTIRTRAHRTGEAGRRQQTAERERRPRWTVSDGQAGEAVRRIAVVLSSGLLAAVLAAGCSAGGPAPYRPTVQTCFSFGLRAIQRHVTVTAEPRACAGLSPEQVNMAALRAVKEAVGPEPQV